MLRKIDTTLTTSTLFLLLLAGNSSSILAAEVVAEAESETGREMTMTFEGEHLTRSTEKALLCTEPTGVITKVRLWMPAHGHGSGPTKLEITDDNCTKITFIDFSMPGNWDLQVTFADGDKGVFHVEVAR